jgi:hypothetical protein
MPSSRSTRTVLHYFLVFLGSSVVLSLLFTGLVYYLAVSDQERVPKIIQEITQKELGVQTNFDHYQFQYFDHFPFLSLSLYNLRLRDTAYERHNRELLLIKELDLVFRPWALLQQKVKIRSVEIDSARLQIYKDTTGYTNLDFLKKSTPQGPLLDSAQMGILQNLNRLTLNNLFFRYEDDSLHKHHRFILDEGVLSFERQDTLLVAQLRGGAFFQGLTFNPRNGPFLENMPVQLDLKFGVPAVSRRWHLLEKSKVSVLENEINVQGYLEPGQPGLLHLEIHTPGISLADGQQIVTRNIREATQKFEIEGDIPVEVVIHGPTIPGQPTPLEVNIEASKLGLSAAGMDFAEVQLRANFRNDCDSARLITPKTGCLLVEVDSALLFGTLPVRFSYFNHNLQSPEVKIKGGLNTPLARLNRYLPENDWVLKSGEIALDFELAGNAASLMDSTVTSPAVQLKGAGQLRNTTLWHRSVSSPFENINTTFRFDTHDLTFTKGALIFEDQKMAFSGNVLDLISLAFNKPNQLWADAKLQVATLNLEDWISALSMDTRPPQADSPFPGQQLGRTLQQITNKLQGRVRVQAETLNYRNIGVTDVVFDATLRRWCTGRQSCIQVDKLRLTAFNALTLTGTAHLAGLSDPQLRFELNSQAPLADLQSLMPQKLLRLKAGDYALQLAYEGSLRSYGSLNQAVLQAGLKGRVQLEDAAFDYLPQSYHFRDVGAAIHFDESHVYIDTLQLTVNGNQGRVSGRIDDVLPFIFGKTTPRLRAVLEVDSRGIDLNAFDFLKPGVEPQEEEGRFVGQIIARALQRIEGELQVRSDTLQYQALRLSDVYFESRFMGACGEEGSCVVLDTVQAELFGNTPMHARARLSQLQDPFLEAQVTVDMPLEELDRMFSSAQLRFRGGRASVQFEYAGQPHRHVDVQEALLKATLRGSGQITGGQFTFVPRGYNFKAVDTRFSFDGADLHLEKVDLLLNQNKINGHGTICNFLPFLFLPDRTLKASFEVQSPRFNLDRFKAPEKFQVKQAKQAESPTDITRLVNAGLENIEADFRMQLDTVNYRDFFAKAVGGRVEMGKGRVAFDDATMDLAGGTFRLSGEVTGLEENEPVLNLQADLQNTDVRKAFRAFDDFGQSALRHQNLEGKLTADIKFQARANANYELDTNSLRGHFDLRLTDGALLDLSALDSIRNLLFARRDLSHIDFATLENTFQLNGQLLGMERMEVRSSALTFAVSGQYDLSTQRRTDMLLEIPMANLFRRDLNRAALEQIEKGLSGPNILLRLLPDDRGEGLRVKWVLSRE